MELLLLTLLSAVTIVGEPPSPPPFIPLARGMNGGGEGGSPTIVTADNSVRSNSSTTNVINETITPLDTLTTSVVSSV